MCVCVCVCVSVCVALARAEILPARDDDLDPSNVPLWVKAGYDEGDTQRFLRVHRWMARMDNINADLKIRLTTNVT